MRLTAIIEREGAGYVSLCPELDIASQGGTVEQARDNLREALNLFFECASPEEIKSRLRPANPASEDIRRSYPDKLPLTGTHLLNSARIC